MLLQMLLFQNDSKVESRLPLTHELLVPVPWAFQNPAISRNPCSIVTSDVPHSLCNALPIMEMRKANKVQLKVNEHWRGPDSLWCGWLTCFDNSVMHWFILYLPAFSGHRNESTTLFFVLVVAMLKYCDIFRYFQIRYQHLQACHGQGACND